MDPISLTDFYQNHATLIPGGINREIGHFNVFEIGEVRARMRKPGAAMPYNRREFYKISFIRGRNRAEYADKVIEIDRMALLFATPQVPYHYLPQDDDQSGCFCIFTAEFMATAKTGVVLDDLPLFRPGGVPVFQLTDEQGEELAPLYRKMQRELVSDYAYKYDLLRAYVLELLHFGQKLQPAAALYPAHTASARVSSLFVELLERQFPIATPQQRLKLRSANDFAERLAVHVNHLNKVLKEHTGKTTTDLIAGRVAQEAKILLRQTDWTVSEIAHSLGFEEVAHFSNFFKKQTSLAPVAFRS